MRVIISEATAGGGKHWYKMQNAKALFWLGKIERVQYKFPMLKDLNEYNLNAIVQAQLVGPAGNLGEAERKLIDDLIAIFDVTLDQFDRRTERELRRTVDQLALTVISRVRVYLAPINLA